MVCATGGRPVNRVRVATVCPPGPVTVMLPAAGAPQLRVVLLLQAADPDEIADPDPGCGTGRGGDGAEQGGDVRGLRKRRSR